MLRAADAPLGAVGNPPPRSYGRGPADSSRVGVAVRSGGRDGSGEGARRSLSRPWERGAEQRSCGTSCLGRPLPGPLGGRGPGRGPCPCGAAGGAEACAVLLPPARRGPGWVLGSVRAAAPRRGKAPGCATPAAAGTGGAAPAPNPAPAASRRPQGAPAVGQPRSAGLRCRAGGGGAEGGRGAAAAVGESDRESGAAAGRPLRAARGEAAELCPTTPPRSGPPGSVRGARAVRGCRDSAGSGRRGRTAGGARGAAGSGASAEDGASADRPRSGPPRRVAPGRLQAVSPAPRNPSRRARGDAEGPRLHKSGCFSLLLFIFLFLLFVQRVAQPLGDGRVVPPCGDCHAWRSSPCTTHAAGTADVGCSGTSRGAGGVGCGLPLSAQQALEAGFPIVIFKRENLLMESPE